MNLIPCAEQCKHQLDGYCLLTPQAKSLHPEALKQVRCVYFSPLSAQDADSFGKL